VVVLEMAHNRSLNTKQQHITVGSALPHGFFFFKAILQSAAARIGVAHSHYIAF